MGNKWIPVKLINQCFIRELKDERGMYLCTIQANNGRRYVKLLLIEYGRVVAKENRIIAYMPIPEAYMG